MKKPKLLIVGMIALSSFSALAQKSNLSASSLVAKAHQQARTFSKSNIITAEASSSNLKNRLSSSLSEFSTFTLNKAQLRSEKETPTDYINLSMPLPDGSSAQVALVKVAITTPDFVVETSTGAQEIEIGQHYRGIINNDPQSLAAISIFENELSGTLSIPGKGDYTIGLIHSPDEIAKGTHIIYNTTAYRGTFPGWDCSVKDDNGIPYSARQLSTDVNAAITKYARLYYETEYDMFTALGSVNAVSTFMLGLHNQVATLYSNDGVNVLMSELNIWTSDDPYNGATAGANLAAFQATRTSFNGDLGQLVTFRDIGGGVAAGFAGLCNPNVASRLSTAKLMNLVNTVPTYSWSVDVVTHEFGHLFGSRHTHACVWNGTNTAIDGCSGFTEGGCALPGIPAAGGTIMSYCHLQTVGKNFSLGFGPQPGSVIRSSVANAACLASNCVLSAAAAWINCYAMINCGWTTFDTYPRKMGDVNGDGKADIIGFGTEGVYYSLSTGTSFNTPVFASTEYGTSSTWINFNTFPREVADVNGDGKADIIGFGASGVYVSFSTGAGFTTPAFVLASYGTSTSAGGWSSYNTYPRKMGDVNGDGKADIVGFGASGVSVALSTGSGFAAPVIALADYSPNLGGWTNYETFPREVADINGDGKADIIGFGGAGVYRSLSLGGGPGGFTAPVFSLANFGLYAGGWSSFNTYPRTLGDVNGDGKADIVGFGTAGVYISLAGAGGTFGSAAYLLNDYGTLNTWINYDTYPRTLADVDGNGKKDIVGFGAYYTYVSPSLCVASALPSIAPFDAGDIVYTNDMKDLIHMDQEYNGTVYTKETGNLNAAGVLTGLDKQSSIAVYPNPANKNVTFSCPNLAKRFEIVNLLGQVVLQKIITAEPYTIELSDMQSGMYYIQFYTENGAKIETKKLLIEK